MISAADFDLLTDGGPDFGRPSGHVTACGRTGGEMLGPRVFEPPTSPSRTVRDTRLRYAAARPAHCTGSSCLPGVLSHQLHELALAARPRLHLTVHLLDDGQHLIHGVADRHHHAATLAELLEERGRDRRPAGRDQYPIERRLVGPAEGAATDPYPDIVVAELLEESAGALGQPRQALDRADAPRELGEHGRLIARAGADLENLFLAGELEQLGHEAHDVGLRDRLLLADRQGVIAVGAITQCFLDEEMTRDAPHHREHALFGDLAARKLLLDHARAGRFVRVARPLHSPRRGFLVAAAAGTRRGGRALSPLSCALKAVDQSSSCVSARWLVRSRWSGVSET